MLCISSQLQLQRESSCKNPMELLCRSRESKAQFIRSASLAFRSIFSTGIRHRERGTRSPLFLPFPHSTEGKPLQGNPETPDHPRHHFTAFLSAVHDTMEEKEGCTRPKILVFFGSKNEQNIHILLH